jgi:hypothetical protein
MTYSTEPRSVVAAEILQGDDGGLFDETLRQRINNSPCSQANLRRRVATKKCRLLDIINLV